MCFTDPLQIGYAKRVMQMTFIDSQRILYLTTRNILPTCKPHLNYPIKLKLKRPRSRALRGKLYLRPVPKRGRAWRKFRYCFPRLARSDYIILQSVRLPTIPIRTISTLRLLPVPPQPTINYPKLDRYKPQSGSRCLLGYLRKQHSI